MIPAKLLVATDRHGSDRPLVETVRAVLDGGARWIWLREKDLGRDARRDLAAELLALVRAAGGWLTIGGDADLAVEIGADGMHLSAGALALTSHSLPHPEVPAPAGLEGGRQGPCGSLEGSFEASASLQHLRMRAEMGHPLLTGVSAHSLADIRAATEAGADYATLSPIFASPSKPGYGPALGPGALREAAEFGMPVIALGGIGPGQARACLAAGAAGVAMMGGLMRAADPGGETRRLLDALGAT